MPAHVHHFQRGYSSQSLCVDCGAPEFGQPAPAQAQAVEVFAYYDPRLPSGAEGNDTLFYSVGTRNVDGSRTWYANRETEESAKQAGEDIAVMLDLPSRTVAFHDQAATFDNADFLADALRYADAILAAEVRPCAEEYATDLDRLLAFGDLIDRSSLKTPAELHTLNYAEQEGDVVLANPSNSQTLYRLTESGRRFLSKFSPIGG